MNESKSGSAPELSTASVATSCPEPDRSQRVLYGALLLYAVTAPVTITGAQIALGIAFLALLYRIRSGRIQPVFLASDQAFAGFTLAGAFSLANAVDLARGVTEMTKFLIILVFWVASWSQIGEQQLRRLLLCLIASGMITSIIAVFKMIYIDEQMRAYGLFSLPITFGEVQSLITLTTLAWLCQNEPSRLVRRFLLVAFFISGGGLLISFTRGAWLGFLGGFLLLLFRYPRRLAPIFLVLALGIGVSIGVSSGVRDRLASFDLQSNFFRFRIWQVGFDILQTSPVFGVGMNNVKSHYRDRVKSFDIEHREVHGHLHNSFMQILVMTGLFGLTMYSWFLLRMLKNLLFWAKFAPTPWLQGMTWGMLSVFVAFLISGITEYNFGDEEVAMLAFFLCGIVGASNFIRITPGTTPGTASGTALGTVPI